MIRTTLAFALLACLTLTGCKKDPPPADWRAPAFGISYAEPCTLDENIAIDLADGATAVPVKLIDDRQIGGAIEAIATKMITDGKTTKAADFAEQLKREKCTLALAKPGSATLSASDIYSQCAPSVLVFSGIFKCGKCNNWHASPASGFVLTEDGVAVTNYHVMEKAANETFVVMTQQGKVYAVKEVLAANMADDLAIVRLDLPAGVKLKPLALAPDAPVGSPVSLISHPDKRFYSLTTGIISRYHTMAKNNVMVPMVSITADYARGSSGAPVLSDKGAVIGLVASTHSVYYSTEGGKQENLQMVFKQCIPAASLMKMIETAK